LRRIIRARCSLHERVLVVFGNLDELFSKLLDRHLFFTKDGKKCFQRILVDPEPVLKVADRLLLLVG
jgi:hypothetical protein